MSDRVFQTVEEAFKGGEWKLFPDGGCSCGAKCSRIHADGEGDFYEPALMEDGQWADPDL